MHLAVSLEKSLLWAWISNKKRIQNCGGIKNMTREQAQDIVNNQGFAWTVTEVIEGDAFNLIYCDWKGKDHLMYYSNNQNKKGDGSFRNLKKQTHDKETLVIMQPESLINFQTVPSLLNAEGNKKLIEKQLLYIDNQRKVKRWKLCQIIIIIEK